MARRTSADRKTRAVTVRMTEETHAALSAAARREGLAKAVLARRLITYGLSGLAAGDAAIQRAVRGSRDITIKPITTPTHARP